MSEKREKEAAETIASCGYTVEKKLGSGFQAAVFSVISSEHPEEGLKAFKNLYLRILEKSEGLSNLVEIDVLNRLRHPNLMYAEGMVFPGNPEDCKVPLLGIIMPLASYTLSGFLDLTLLTPKTRLRLMYEVICGVDFLHRMGIVHRDLAFTNIFVQGTLDNPHSLVADFGISVYSEADNQRYNYEEDVRDLGILMAMFLAPKPLFTEEESRRMEEDIKYKLLVLSGETWQTRIENVLGETWDGQLLPLVLSMTGEEEKRPRLDKVLKDPLFRELSPVECGLGEELPVLNERKEISSVPPELFTELTQVLGDNFPEASVATLFLALDLTLRTAELLKSNKYLHLSTCLWISVKILAPSQWSVKYFKWGPNIKISLEETLPQELLIVRYLGGRLYRRWFYQAARNLDDLMEVYQLLVQVKIDSATEVEKTLRSLSFDPDAPDKDVSLEVFLQRITV